MVSGNLDSGSIMNWRVFVTARWIANQLFDFELTAKYAKHAKNKVVDCRAERFYGCQNQPQRVSVRFLSREPGANARRLILILSLDAAAGYASRSFVCLAYFAVYQLLNRELDRSQVPAPFVCGSVTIR